MTVRIHFTALDLARTRVAPVGPVDETAAAIWLLKRREGELLLGGWRRQKLDRLDPVARRLGALIPVASCVSLDVFTLSGGPAQSMPQALEHLRGRSAGDVAAEARHADSSRRMTSWTRGLVGADSQARGLLDESLEVAYRCVVAPHWQQISAHYAARAATYSRIFLSGGVDALLRSLHPAIRWEPPTLVVPAAAGAPPQDRHLAGRGVVLAPAFFDLVPRITWDLADEVAAPILHIPPPDVVTRARVLVGTAPEDGSAAHLAGLMGHTRAAVLQRIAEGATTTEIAQRVGIAPASASEHASALRAAGLTRSERIGNRMWHTATEVGISLLNSPGR